MRKDLVVAVVLILLPINLQAQLDKDQSGAWYMYFWNTAPQENRWVSREIYNIETGI